MCKDLYVISELCAWRTVRLLILQVSKCGYIVMHVNGVALTECEGLRLQTILHFVISGMSKLIRYTVKTPP